MDNILCLLLISLGALLMVAIFQFSIYLQQSDKAFLYYSLYLFVMSAFVIVRILDARLTTIFPLSYHQLETIDPILSNTGFLMYVNFLGVLLKITPQEKFYYRSWKFLQVFIVVMLCIYAILQYAKVSYVLSDALITICSFLIIGFGGILAVRIFHHINEKFFRLVIIGTVIAVLGVMGGLIVNALVYKEKLAFEGLFLLLPAMMIETVFLSAALGYRLKLAYLEKEKAQQKLIEEINLNRQLALQTSALLQKELNMQNMQRRISRDLHDDVGASLSSIHIYSTVARQIMDVEPEKARKILDQININAHTVIDNMSDIIWAMNTNSKEAGISDKIKNIGYELLTAANIDCNYTLDEALDEQCRDIDVRRNIYLIVKEAFNNMAKYSGATKAAVSLQKCCSHIELIISDNGKGFDVAVVIKGNGLHNMVERATHLGGGCTLTTNLNCGTKITCSFPLTIFSDTLNGTLS